VKTLLLNSDYTPRELIGWKQALSLLWQENEPVVCLHSSTKYKTDSKGRKHYIPSVLILKNYQRHSGGPATYSKSNIFARDKRVCQYCYKTCTPENITIDHVIPRSRWKSHARVSSFENVVTACKRCNKRKGDKTPVEAGMHLLNQPKRISRAQLLARKALILGLTLPEWHQYLESYND
jgi:hypothetical protein